MPEPHRRLTVSAGTSIGTPALSADMPRAVDRVGAGLQHVAEDDVIDALRLDAGALASPPRAAIAPSSIAETSFSVPT